MMWASTIIFIENAFGELTAIGQTNVNINLINIGNFDEQITELWNQFKETESNSDQFIGWLEKEHSENFQHLGTPLFYGKVQDF